MKHDSINMTAPHTARELAQAESEAAGCMRAERIAQMICEDEALGESAENAHCFPKGDLISREAAKAREVFAESCPSVRHAIEYFEELMRQALPAAPAPQKGEGVRVKPLVWERGVFFAQPCYYAETKFGPWIVVSYRGRRNRWAHTDPAGVDSEADWETADEAKAAAQADYEARILSAPDLPATAQKGEA